MGFPSGPAVKNMPTTQETWVQSLDREDLLEQAWQPTLVLLPGESHGQRSLVGYSPQGLKESDMTEHSTGKVTRICLQDREL